MKITLPLPPSANRYWRLWNNRMVISTEARAYKEQVGWLCRDAGIEPLVGDIAITLHIYRKQKRGDVDNFIKCGLDALNGHLWIDDSQIVEIHAYRHDDKDNSRIEIEAEIVYERA